MEQKYDFEFDDIEIGGVNYYASGTAYSEYYYKPGSMYRRNGDPGDPPEEERELLEINYKTVSYQNEKDETIEFNCSEGNEEIMGSINEIVEERIMNNEDGWE